MQKDELLTEPETARRLGCSVSGLRKWRTEGTGPRYIRIGRLIRYQVADLDKWLSAQTVDPEHAA